MLEYMICALGKKKPFYLQWLSTLGEIQRIMFMSSPGFIHVGKSTWISEIACIIHALWWRHGQYACVDFDLKPSHPLVCSMYSLFRKYSPFTCVLRTSSYCAVYVYFLEMFADLVKIQDWHFIIYWSIQTTVVALMVRLILYGVKNLIDRVRLWQTELVGHNLEMQTPTKVWNANMQR